VPLQPGCWTRQHIEKETSLCRQHSQLEHSGARSRCTGHERAKLNDPVEVGLSMTAARLGIILYVVLGLMLFIISALWAFEELKIRNRLRKAGKTTEAEIIKSGEESLGRSVRYYVTYRFGFRNEAGENRYFSETRSISNTHLSTLQGRSTVTVSYDLENPKISRLSGIDQDETRLKSAKIYMFLVVCSWAIAILLFMATI
jgi:hypothetical protein